jgi:phage tail sheath protein FI
MPEYLSPGVYVQEMPSATKPIEGVGTAMAAFVGFAATGPANRPALITNWSQYVNTFGSLEDGGQRNPHVPGAYLSHAVYGYFLNGGGRCYVTRVVGTPAEQEKPEPVQVPSRSSKAVPSLIVHRKENTGQDIQVDILPPSKTALPPTEGDGQTTEQASQSSQSGQELFNLRVRMGDAEELYENLSLGKQGKSSVETITQTSQLIRVVEAKATGTAIERAPQMGSYIVKAPLVTTLPQVQSSHFSGNVADRSGLEGLEVAEDVTMVCCPDLMAAYLAEAIDKDGVKAVQLAMIAHCERMGDRVAILDPLPDLSPQEVKRWREQETGYDSKYAMLYYPWIKVAGNGRPLMIPPSGHISGIYARNDNERGVHKAPANEVIRGALEAVTQITKGEQDTLNPVGVNCIRSFTGRGLRVWGARTLSSEGDWRYVNVRRLFNYIEKSIEQGTQWVVFEPNDPDLWARVKRDVGAFLTGAWRDGMLFGRTPEEAFFVKCDEENNPQDVRDRGQLFIDIGLAPVKPAEFVIFRLSQWAGGGA